MAEQLLPFVSVVIPTAGRPQLLERCLEHLARQDYPADRYEVVVAENGVARPSSERRASSPDGHPQIRMLALSATDANAARNAGIAVAAGDPIVLIDDDSLAPPPWLRALMGGVLRHPEAGCVGGPVRPLFDSSPPPTCAVHQLPGATLEAGPDETEIDEVWGCNMAVRRFALAEIGPFREGLRFSQDWEWQHRLRCRGGKIVYVPDAGLDHVRHGQDLRLTALLRQHTRRGWFIAGELRSVGALGRRDAPRAAARSGHSLAHAISARCARGALDAAREGGRAARLLLTSERRSPAKARERQR